MFELQKYTTHLNADSSKSPLKLLELNPSYGVNRGASLTSAGMATSGVIEGATASIGVVHNELFHGVITTEDPPLHEDGRARKKPIILNFPSLGECPLYCYLVFCLF